MEEPEIVATLCLQVREGGADADRHDPGRTDGQARRFHLDDLPDNDEMKLIVGMHRSGTSLVAQICFAAGADMGDSATFYRPDRWNPEGYFEQTDVHAINMPLVHGPLWKFSYYFLPSERTIRRRGRSRAEQIRRATAKYRGKVVKENRFCLTLPAWLDHGAEVERLLVVVREPGAVARSLRRRNRVTLKKAFSLWLVHNQRLLDIAERQRIPYWFVRYGFLLHPEHQLDEAVSALAFLGVATSPGGLRRLLSSVVKRDLNHHSRNDPQVKSPAQVADLWNELVHAHQKQRHHRRTYVLNGEGEAQ